MPLGDLFLEQMTFAENFNVLKLTDAHVAILSAVLIMEPGL